MTWVRIYNTLPSNPKVLMAGERAAWLYVCGLCYSNEHLTDGFIARHVLPVAAPGVKHTEALARQLVVAGLWHEVDGGWQTHDYGDHQRSAAEIRERRARDAERKATARSAGSPRGQTADAERSPQGVRGDRSRVEGRVEEIPATQVARKRATTRRIDLSSPPENFPEALRGALVEALAILHRTWEVRGGRTEPSMRGVGMAMMRKPDIDHVALALRLEHWLLAGNGQRASTADIAARYGDWHDGESGKPETKIVSLRDVREQEKRERQERGMAALNRIVEQGRTG